MDRQQQNLAVIKSAISSQDQLVFVYQKEKGKVSTRYVTPVEILPSVDDEGWKTVENNSPSDILCIQHLPKDGFRRFKLDKIKSIHRVITRNMPEHVLSNLVKKGSSNTKKSYNSKHNDEEIDF